MKIKQNQELVRENYWKWSIELEANPEVLDRIAFVIYTLHETFPNPIRRISSREDNFRLETSGWGEFMIYAKVLFKDKSQIRLTHWLELANTDGTRTEK